MNEWNWMTEMSVPIIVLVVVVVIALIFVGVIALVKGTRRDTKGQLWKRNGDWGEWR